MLILRLIVLLAIIVAIYWLVKRLFSPDPAVANPQPAKSEDMRQCKYCGVHVPDSSVVAVDNQAYCCREHAELDRQ